MSVARGQRVPSAKKKTIKEKCAWMQPPSLLQRLVTECPGCTSERELREILQIMGILAAENDLSTLNAFAGNLSNEALTDVMIASLDHLPPREAVCGNAPAPAAGGLAGLMQGLAESSSAAVAAAVQLQPSQQIASAPQQQQGMPAPNPLPVPSLVVAQDAYVPAIKVCKRMWPCRY